MASEAGINKARAENYRAQAVLMRDMGAAVTDERMRADCLEMAAKWDALAKRLEELNI